jgi:hypothetical protein
MTRYLKDFVGQVVRFVAVFEEKNVFTLGLSVLKEFHHIFVAHLRMDQTFLLREFLS